MIARFVAVALVLSASVPASADPSDLKQFGLVCFCTSRVATPHRLVNVENNGRILLLARNGVTKSQLAAAGVGVSDTQLHTLQDWGLLARQGERFTTAFPILGSSEMEALRTRLTPTAAALATKIMPELKAVQAELRTRGHAQSAEAVLFAYILDGLTWRALEERQSLPSQKIDAVHPYWNGTFWAVYPKQENMPGTNSQTTANRELRMMWTSPVLPWFDRVAQDKGVPGAVVIRENASDPIAVRGRKIAADIASAVISAKLDDVIPAADPKQRVLIATHELIWMLLDRANRDLRVVPPPALKAGARTIEEVAPLVVVIERAGTP